MSVKQIEEAIAQLPSSEFAKLLACLEMHQRELNSERETAYLLGNPTIKARLLEARQSTQGIALEEVPKGQFSRLFRFITWHLYWV